MIPTEYITIANRTSRASGAVGKNALVPRVVRQYLANCDDDVTILDFGSGKKAIHAIALQNEGWNVTAWEFGDNIDSTIHDVNALDRKYDVVYASNVLNVQVDRNMMSWTLDQLADVTEHVLFCNYPNSPRKSDLVAKDVENMLRKRFRVIEKVAGTNSAPVWKCVV